MGVDGADFPDQESLILSVDVNGPLGNAFIRIPAFARCCFCIAASLLVLTSPIESPLALAYQLRPLLPTGKIKVWKDDGRFWRFFVFLPSNDISYPCEEWLITLERQI